MEILEKNRGKVVSGEEIARALGVTRASVCKDIAKLRRDGNENFFQKQFRLYFKPVVACFIRRWNNLQNENRSPRRLFFIGGFHKQARKNNGGRGRVGRDRNSCRQSDRGARTKRTELLFACRQRTIFFDNLAPRIQLCFVPAHSAPGRRSPYDGR